MQKPGVWQVVGPVLLLLLILFGILAAAQYQAANAAQAEVDCVRPWLDKAMALHDKHLKDPATATAASQRELMDQIMQAYECVVPQEEMPPMSH